MDLLEVGYEVVPTLLLCILQQHQTVFNDRLYRHSEPIAEVGAKRPVGTADFSRLICLASFAHGALPWPFFTGTLLWNCHGFSRFFRSACIFPKSRSKSMGLAS